MDSKHSFLFNITRTRQFRAFWFERAFQLQLLARIQTITKIIFAASAALFIALFTIDALANQPFIDKLILRSLASLSLFSFAYTVTIYILKSFHGSLIEYRANKEEESNIAVHLSYEAAKSVIRARAYAKQKGFTVLNSSILIHGILTESKTADFVFWRGLADKQQLLRTLDTVLQQLQEHQKQNRVISDDFPMIIQMAYDSAKAHGRREIMIEDLLVVLADTNAIFQEFIVNEDLTAKDLFNLAFWYRTNQDQIELSKKFWLPRNLKRWGTLGRGWASAYTITLDQYARELTAEVKQANFPRAVGHKAEKETLERTLSRNERNNILLVGDPGSGKNRLVTDFTSKVVLGECENQSLNYQRIMQLDISYLLASAENFNEIEQLIGQVFQEAAQAGNIIMVLEDVHNYTDTGEGERDPGKIDITGILGAHLRQSSLPVIATTTYEGLTRNIEQNPAFLSYFETVRISELTPDETLQVLQEHVPFFEEKYKRTISYPALKATVDFAERYIQNIPFPKKAIDLLDSAMVYIARSEENILLPEHIAAIVTEQTNIPVGTLKDKERDTLLNLETLMHQRIIGQEEAIEEIASSLRRSRSEVATRKGPMGSFLFLGPTGVGKTETAKALAHSYFGSEKRMIRLDMSEFQAIEDIARLLGSTKQAGQLTTPVRRNPFSLVLLDELEKAHTNILNIFLQVLDEGYITDGIGRKVDFRNTIIIATSNAAYQIILDAIQEGKDFSEVKEEVFNYLFEQGTYRPEFLNRFDAVVLFKPLTKANLLDIADLMLQQLQKNLEKKGIGFTITPELKEKIVELGYDQRFGARDMRRVIQDKIEDAFAVALLNNQLKRGKQARINPEDFSVQIA